MDSLNTNPSSIEHPKGNKILTACVVSGVAGATILSIGAILGITGVFGQVGSIEFIASTAGGGAIVLLSISGITWQIIVKSKANLRPDDHPNNRDLTSYFRALQQEIQECPPYVPKENESSEEKITVDDTDDALDNTKFYLLDRHFEEIDRAIQEERDPNFCHCVQGISKSATVIYAYLINRCNVTLEQAHNYIQTKCPTVALNPDMQQGLEGYALYLRVRKIT